MCSKEISLDKKKISMYHKRYTQFNDIIVRNSMNEKFTKLVHTKELCHACT